MIGTYSGKLVDPLNLSLSDIDIEDVAHSLAIQNRYTGHTKFPLSVAQHSLLLSYNVPKHLAFAALMHDAPEAFISDIAYPIKSQLEGYQALEDAVTAVFAEKFGIPLQLFDDVKPYDRRICVDEINQLCNFRDPSLEDVLPLRVGKIREMSWRDAEDEFLDRFYDLYDDDDGGPSPVDVEAYMGVDRLIEGAWA